jgi:hypothetical protein
MRDIKAMSDTEFLEFFLETLSKPNLTIERVSNE